MEDLNIYLMQIISYSGESKSLCLEALQQRRENRIEKSKETYKLAEENLYSAKRVHAQILKEFANDTLNVTNLLLIHAEDQMMSSETIYLLTNELFHCIQQTTNV